ncbi:MAG: hypothetical protein IJQ71_03160 [Clostridia bacterium]|nr:hypothetical protein [Clostridia bacterium]
MRKNVLNDLNDSDEYIQKLMRKYGVSSVAELRDLLTSEEILNIVRSALEGPQNIPDP